MNDDFSMRYVVFQEDNFTVLKWPISPALGQSSPAILAVVSMHANRASDPFESRLWRC